MDGENDFGNFKLSDTIPDKRSKLPKSYDIIDEAGAAIQLLPPSKVCKTLASCPTAQPNKALRKNTLVRVD